MKPLTISSLVFVVVILCALMVEHNFGAIAGISFGFSAGLLNGCCYRQGVYGDT